MKKPPFWEIIRATFSQPITHLTPANKIKLYTPASISSIITPTPPLRLSICGCPMAWQCRMHGTGRKPPLHTISICHCRERQAMVSTLRPFHLPLHAKDLPPTSLQLIGSPDPGESKHNHQSGSNPYKKKREKKEKAPQKNPPRGERPKPVPINTGRKGAFFIKLQVTN